jgi:hypothetical protein
VVVELIAALQLIVRKIILGFVYLQEFDDFRNIGLENGPHGVDTIGALLTGPLLGQAPPGGAGLQGGADGGGIKEGRIEGESNDGPVDSENSLTEGRILVGWAQGLHQHLGLMGQTFCGLQTVS